jgi:hypothetical protein
MVRMQQSAAACCVLRSHYTCCRADAFQGHDPPSLHRTSCVIWPLSSGPLTAVNPSLAPSAHIIMLLQLKWPCGDGECPSSFPLLARRLPSCFVWGCQSRLNLSGRVSMHPAAKTAPQQSTTASLMVETPALLHQQLLMLLCLCRQRQWLLLAMAAPCLVASSLARRRTLAAVVAARTCRCCCCSVATYSE